MEDRLTVNASRFTHRVGQLFFRLRSLTPIPFILILIYFSHSTPISIAIGIPLLLFGEWVRVWAVGYAGGSTRGQTVGCHPFACDSGPLSIRQESALFGQSAAQSRYVLDCQCVLDECRSRRRLFRPIYTNYPIRGDLSVSNVRCHIPALLQRCTSISASPSRLFQPVCTRFLPVPRLKK